MIYSLNAKNGKPLNDTLTHQRSVSLAEWIRLFLFSFAAVIAFYLLLRSMGFRSQAKEVAVALQSIVFILASLRALGSLGIDIEKAAQYYKERVFDSLKDAFRYFLILIGAGVLIVGAVVLTGLLLTRMDLLPADVLSNFLTPDSPALGIFLQQSLLDSPWRSILFLTTACTLAPIGEELIFRRLLYVSLRHKYGLVISLTMSSLLFGLIHGGQWFSVFSKGLIIGYVYERDRNILTAIFLHALVNILALALGFWGQYI